MPAAPSLNAVADREESKSLTAAEEGEAPPPPKREGLLRFFQGGRPSKSATREGGASETPKDGTEKSKNSKNISARAPSQDTKRAVTLQVTRPADTDAASADIDAAASISVLSSTATEHAAPSTLEQALNVITSRKVLNVTCFPSTNVQICSTKVQMLTHFTPPQGMLAAGRGGSPHFTCLTNTKVQTLTHFTPQQAVAAALTLLALLVPKYEY